MEARADAAIVLCAGGEQKHDHFLPHWNYVCYAGDRALAKGTHSKRVTSRRSSNINSDRNRGRSTTRGGSRGRS